MRTPFDAAKAYLAKLPPAISGAGGHDATFRAACELVRFGLGDGEAMALLREYNARCQPPWTERDLAHKLADAHRAAGGNVRRFERPAPPPVRVVWKVTRTIQRKPEALLEPKPAPPLAIPGDTGEVRQPWITKAGDLVIPFNSPSRFHWWKEGGQSITETRKEFTQ